MKVTVADTIIEVGGIQIGPSLTKEQAEKLYELGQEAIVFVLLTQAKMIAQQTLCVRMRETFPCC